MMIEIVVYQEDGFNILWRKNCEYKTINGVYLWL